MIYFIECRVRHVQYVKIGYSKDPENRMKQLQTGNPLKLKLLGYIPGDLSQEALFHAYFKATRLPDSEWFKVRKEGRMFFGLKVLTNDLTEKLAEFCIGKLINLESFISLSLVAELSMRRRKHTKKGYAKILSTSDKNYVLMQKLTERLSSLMPSKGFEEFLNTDIS